MNESLEKRLDDFLNNEASLKPDTFSLVSIRKIMESMGDHHLVLPSIHIAGTNGKGSVAAFCESIFRAAGYRTGKYTSPHLKRINERIALNGKPIEDEVFHELLDDVLNAARKKAPGATYFDILTAVSMEYFYRQKCDICIFETGLGGRLDSTNILSPRVTVITSVSYDHAAFLGDGLLSIAGEKAGIIKKNVPLVVARQNDEIKSLLKDRALQNCAPCHFSGEDFLITHVYGSSSGVKFIFSSPLNEVEIPLSIQSPVREQGENAALACMSALLLREVFPLITPSLIAAAVKETSLRGRFELLLKKPLLLYDPAHNRSAVESLFSTIARSYAGYDIVTVISLMRDKETGPILETVRKGSREVCYFCLDDERSYLPATDKGEDTKMKLFSQKEELAEALNSLASERTLFLVTGSFRLYELSCFLRDELPRMT